MCDGDEEDVATAWDRSGRGSIVLRRGKLAFREGEVDFGAD